MAWKKAGNMGFGSDFTGFKVFRAVLRNALRI